MYMPCYERQLLGSLSKNHSPKFPNMQNAQWLDEVTCMLHEVPECVLLVCDQAHAAKSDVHAVGPLFEPFEVLTEYSVMTLGSTRKAVISQL
jgi:hypothetical protein